MPSINRSRRIATVLPSRICLNQRRTYALPAAEVQRLRKLRKTPQPPPSRPKTNPGQKTRTNPFHNLDDPARPHRWVTPIRTIAFFGAAATAICLGLFTTSFLIANSGDPPRYRTGEEPIPPTGRPAIQSPLEFDNHLNKSEYRYGITSLRRKIGAEATGHVLEVAMGTGRNFEFYDWDKMMEDFVDQSQRGKQLLEKSKFGLKNFTDVKDMLSFTGVDISVEMLDIGLMRVRQFVPYGVDALPLKPSFAKLAEDKDLVDLLDGKLRVFRDDVQHSLPVPPPGIDKYDTIVQTFGLCSVRDPTALIENMAKIVRPGTGRIILLEHGRSWWHLVNNMLDRSAKGHFERFGCWWNRNIEDIVEEAKKKIPELEVVELERPGVFNFGTHIWIELRVRDKNRKEDDEVNYKGKLAAFQNRIWSWR